MTATDKEALELRSILGRAIDLLSQASAHACLPVQMSEELDAIVSNQIAPMEQWVVKTYRLDQ